MCFLAFLGLTRCLTEYRIPTGFELSEESQFAILNTLFIQCVTKFEAVTQLAMSVSYNQSLLKTECKSEILWSFVPRTVTQYSIYEI